ncbi:nuclear transcription factor Y subunit B-9-like [Mercurialis annua]|uniref:nuclear transcription factor Y subunit B-9-like n=1 Tax=Mercurialis annua TaxID=3986 RepID=UPI00215FFDE5|nr:nuclear transcription factor Y subunit B-9-like [Mercurialis annua]
MERGGRLHRYRRHATQPPTATFDTNSGIGLMHATNSSNINLQNTLSPNPNTPMIMSNTAPTPQPSASQCLVREQDQYMPIANVIRIMRRILPPHAKISDDAKETIQECVSEYISFITGEANDRCQREQRKTITAEDVLWAMGKLGFDDYVEPLKLFMNRYREMENDRGSIREPILRRSSTGGVLDYGNYGNYGMMSPFMPTFPMVAPPPPPPQGVFDGAMMNGYYRNNISDGGSGPGSSNLGGSSSSQNPLVHNYDPFSQFK